MKVFRRQVALLLVTALILSTTCMHAFAAAEPYYIDKCFKPSTSSDAVVTTGTDAQGRTVITISQSSSTRIFTFNADGSVIVDQDGHLYYFRGAIVKDNKGAVLMDTSYNVGTDESKAEAAYRSICNALGASEAEIEGLKASDAKAFTSGARGTASSTGILGYCGSDAAGGWYSDEECLDDSIRWSLKDGVLTLTGIGEAVNVSLTVGTFTYIGGSGTSNVVRELSISPFNGNKTIKTVVVGSGIEDIDELIGYLPNLETVIILGNTSFSLVHVPKLKTIISGADLNTRCSSVRALGSTHYSEGAKTFGVTGLMLTEEVQTSRYLRQYNGQQPSETQDNNTQLTLENAWLVTGARIRPIGPNPDAIETTWAAAFQNYCTRSEMIARAKAAIAAAALTDEALALLPVELGGTAPAYQHTDGRTVSVWAKEPVNRAYRSALIPTDNKILGRDYTAAITRGQYAELAVALYETITGTTLSYADPYTVSVEYGKWTENGFVSGVREETHYIRYNHFADSNSGAHPHAEAMGKLYKLGVITGYNAAESIYDVRLGPDDRLTREQAAVMLARLADKLGIQTKVIQTPFTDKPSDWAVEGIARIYSVGVMNGTAATVFSPAADYTIEQSIITMMRMFDLCSR